MIYINFVDAKKILSMNIQLIAVSKIKNLPEKLLYEVNDFIDFLTIKYKLSENYFEIQDNQDMTLYESDFSDYLKNLENYEQLLAKGKVKW